MPQPIVAVIGRPNVGKSSLFNRILGRRQAIVSEVAGTTRDRLISQVQWDDYEFILVDTGGLEQDPEGSIREKVQDQAEMAMTSADVIVFMTDVTEGLTHADQMVAERLRRTEKPIILAVNKVDNESREFDASEFYRLGLGDPIPISAYHHYGIYYLMDQVISHFPPLDPFPENSDEEPDEPIPNDPGQLKLSIVGRTNVGKSMLLNAILGEERSIVSQVAGTTRDALDTSMTYGGHDITLIDTAGMRRPGQVQRGIEKYSVIRAVSAVNRSDIALLVVDATELAAAQDAHIAGLAWDVCRGLIVVVNKWDLVDRNARGVRERAVAKVRERLHFMPYVPVVFTSALESQGITALMQTALELWRERLRFVPARELQYVLADAMAAHAPPVGKGRRRHNRLNISRLRQVDVNPPTFLFTVDNPQLVHFSYQRYLENKLRTSFGFDQTHLRLIFKK
ncbi:MAG: ribosome biogenesis GTPase Der [SAR202 cluster bacterium Io17-Chloro-G4]|nr:MAG: ribosome biogenesis GTPase Der [SAR202 cluster bacterium Io17-Chloro-G4]